MGDRHSSGPAAWRDANGGTSVSSLEMVGVIAWGSKRYSIKLHERHRPFGRAALSSARRSAKVITGIARASGPRVDWRVDMEPGSRYVKRHASPVAFQLPQMQRASVALHGWTTLRLRSMRQGRSDQGRGRVAEPLAVTQLSSPSFSRTPDFGVLKLTSSAVRTCDGMSISHRFVYRTCSDEL
jgi:hypothetical protein